MITNGGASRRGVHAKYVAVAWIVLLEIIAAVYLYSNPVSGESQNPFIVQTATTTKSTTSTTKITTHPPADRITVESAIISNDTLMMLVNNLGPSATKLFAVTSVCTPGFQTCYDYKKLAGAYYQSTFVLPAARTFKANFTGVCTIALPSCKTYLPVANATYYLQVKFTYADGATVLIPISVMANNTWSKYPTAIFNITSASLEIIPRNLTGLLNVTLTVNDSLPYASWTTVLNAYTKPSSAFSGAILSNETGCTSSDAAPGQGYSIPSSGYNYTSDCSDGTFTVLTNFYTVLTGISSTPYYSLVVRDTTDIDNRTGGFPDCDSGSRCSNFAFWLQGYTNSTG